MTPGLEVKLFRVKRELRRIKQLSHAIEAERKKHGSSQRLENITSEREALTGVYMPAIDRLEPVDKSIILSFIKGESHADIGARLGYSEVGIRRRCERAFEQIASDIKW